MVKLIREKGRLFMFCSNCGNRLDENACVCVNCGVLVRNRSDIKVVKKKKDTKVIGIVSVIFGVMAMLSSLMLFFNDISSVGMYTKVYERVGFALDYAIISILLSTVTLIFSLVSKKNTYSNIGLILSLLSFFFIISEFIVVIIY